MDMDISALYSDTKYQHHTSIPQKIKKYMKLLTYSQGWRREELRFKIEETFIYISKAKFNLFLQDHCVAFS
jgi:hypothetical protein